MASRFSSLLPPNYRQQVRHWIEDDAPGFDVGGFVVGDDPAFAVLYGKKSGPFAVLIGFELCI
jgi:hypothetical protein